MYTQYWIVVIVVVTGKNTIYIFTSVLIILHITTKTVTHNTCNVKTTKTTIVKNKSTKSKSDSSKQI